MNIIKDYFKDWTFFEKTWLLLSTLIILVLSLYWKDTIIGTIASLTGIWCVVLLAKGKISNYYFGIINCITYAYVAYNYRYYGEVMLNIGYYLPMQFVGFFIWSKNRKNLDRGNVNIKIMTNKQRIFWSIICIVSIFGYGLILKYLNGKLPFVDATSTILSVIAMILMARLYLEQWILWLIVDAVTIIMWFVVMIQGGNDISILIMWIAFLVTGCYGLINWIKLYNNEMNV